VNFWYDLINRASLGSTKLPLKASELPTDVCGDYDLVDGEDAEENFLKYSSLIYQFRQSGTRPLNLTSIGHGAAENEDKPYCSSHANNALSSVIAEEMPQLIELWLRLCVTKHQLAHPEMIPLLLDIGQKKKEFRKFVTGVCGKRGEWLASINPRWSFSSVQEDRKTLWETGTFDARKDLLRDLRIDNPEMAMEFLQLTWSSEGANEKTAFLEILKKNLSPSEVIWLEGLKEKGQKVNSAILDLLKSIPTSTIIKEYVSILKNIVRLKTGKALLGMINKTSLAIDDTFSFPDSIFKTGIDKLSSDKNITDHQYIVSQLTASVPPSFFNEHLQLDTKIIIDYFKKEKDGFYLQALASASIRYKELQWVRALLDQCGDLLQGSTLVMLIDLLPGAEKDSRALQFIREKPTEIIQLMIHSEHEWSVELSKAILKYTAGEIYQFNRGFYRPASILIPVSLIDSLESFTPAEEQKKVYWKNQADEIVRLLAIKKQILQSFNA
jgi:hypothetical protein